MNLFTSKIIPTLAQNTEQADVSPVLRILKYKMLAKLCLNNF